MTDLPLSSIIAGLPKAELHLHLETSLRLRRLLWQRDEDPAVEHPHLVADPSLFSGYDRLRRLRYASRTGRIGDGAYTRANIAAITAELIREVAAQSVRHVEIRVGGRRGFALLGVRGMLEAMAEGADGARPPHLSYGFIVTAVRERGPQEAAALVEAAAACRDCHVVGVDLAGDEENYPPALFVEAANRARDAGLGITIHAGEFTGPAGIWTAVYQLGATRIGHGIRAADDPVLMDRLRERGVALEICPTSNLRLGLVSSLPAHPLRRFLERGVPVSINSDDPVLLGTSLSRELAAVARAYRLGPDDLVGLMVTAARAAFLPDDARVALEGQIRSAPLPAP
ncbi:MAG: adenosine deaminase [Armatimonadota bacterium]|nr:adenosine deaminase [Armatimonadota bacterium]